MIIQNSVKVNGDVSDFCNFVVIYKSEAKKMWNLYKRIELLCKEKNINITQMCREIQMPRSIMSELKAGRTIRLSADNSSKLAQYFGVSVNYFLNNAPFDIWEELDNDRKGFFYYLHIPEDTLKNIWGIDKDNPNDASISDIIYFLSNCVKSASVDEGGGWFIELVSEYEALWCSMILQEKDYQFDRIIPLPKTKKVPLLGTIACGEPIIADENIELYIKVDENVPVDFALRCKGDSMINARIFDGDIVYIRQQQDVENGEIAAVLIGDEATLKKVHKYPNKLVLSACNPMYDDFVYTSEQLNDIRILGKAVAFFSFIK